MKVTLEIEGLQYEGEMDLSPVDIAEALASLTTDDIRKVVVSLRGGADKEWYAIVKETLLTELNK